MALFAPRGKDPLLLIVKCIPVKLPVQRAELLKNLKETLASALLRTCDSSPFKARSFLADSIKVATPKERFGSALQSHSPNAITKPDHREARPSQ